MNINSESIFKDPDPNQILSAIDQIFFDYIHFLSKYQWIHDFQVTKLFTESIIERNFPVEVKLNFLFLHFREIITIYNLILNKVDRLL